LSRRLAVATGGHATQVARCDLGPDRHPGRRRLRHHSGATGPRAGRDGAKVASAMTNDAPHLLRVGITGHVYLTRRSERLVYDGLVEVLRVYAGCALRGVTCLAEGADQLFARAVVAAGGTYEVILPARDYRRRCISAARTRDFDDLLGR